MPSANPRRVRELDLSTGCPYVLFVCSSGHCSLDCAYCVANPVAKHLPSLTYEDFSFLFERIGGRAFLIFSGKGDFFAGYRKPERLLDRLLHHDIEVALDINGVILHEFAELSSTQLSKIRFINLTLHYTQVMKTNAAQAWIRNANTLIERKGGASFLSGLILSPPERGLWREAVEFYERHVYRTTGQPLVLIQDVAHPFNADDLALVDRLRNTYGDLVEEVHQEDFATRFAAFEHVLCPAGSRYFRIWNDGRVEGCPYIDTLRECGNLKQRTFQPRNSTLFACRQARYCDCNNIALAGKMHFPNEVTS